VAERTYTSIKSAVFIVAADAPTATTYATTLYSVDATTMSTVSAVTETAVNAQLSLVAAGYNWDNIAREERYQDGLKKFGRKRLTSKG
jgi:hypothetical protein